MVYIHICVGFWAENESLPICNIGVRVLLTFEFWFFIFCVYTGARVFANRSFYIWRT